MFGRVSVSRMALLIASVSVCSKLCTSPECRGVEELAEGVLLRPAICNLQIRFRGGGGGGME